MKPLILVFVLVAAPVSAQSPLLERAVDLANGAALVAHAADLATTVRCTTAGTCAEANAILRPFAGGDDPSQVAFFTIKMGTALASYAVKARTLTLAIAETVAFALVANHNRRIHEAGR
jgi:hypothetical protein